MKQQTIFEKLGQFWKREEVKLFIGKQIEEAGLQFYRVQKNYVCLVHRATVNENGQADVKFIVTLGRGYPVTAPQVHIADSFPVPSLKGYKDYLKTIIGCDWSSDSCLKDIVVKLPQFLGELEMNQNSFEFMQNIGEYHKNRIYSYPLLKELSESGPYIAFQTTEQKVVLYIIGLTSTHFVLFKPIVQPLMVDHKLRVPLQGEIEELKILFVAEIQGLFEIRHNRAEKNEYTFKFDGEQKKNQSVSLWAKKLKITKSTQLIDSLMKKFKNFKGAIDLQTGEHELESAECRLLLQAKVSQHVLKHRFNCTTVNQLNDVYQKVVEFYAELQLPYQQIYLRKIAQLFSREDVKLIMFQAKQQEK